MVLFKGFEGKKLIHYKIYCDGCGLFLLMIKQKKDVLFQKKNGNDFCDFCSKNFKYRRKTEVKLRSSSHD